MNKFSPFFHGHNDRHIFNVDLNEINFSLNARRLFDFGFGERFDENIINKLDLKVGFFRHTNKAAIEGDDSVFERFIDGLHVKKIKSLYALPTGDSHSELNIDSLEIVHYEPPLIAKISPNFADFSMVRGGMVGLSSGQWYMFSSCLNYSLLDWNGHYSFIVGPREFVEYVLSDNIENSWNVVKSENEFEPSILVRLRNAMNAYGIF
jgi:hypothetical protein